MKNIYMIVLAGIIYISGYSQTDEETQIGTTYYDFQTLRTIQNRAYQFNDGTIGTVWNMGFNFPQFSDMGIGYNYYDGDEWNDDPTSSIVSQWATNPSYAPCLENGEMLFYETIDGIGFS